MTEMKIFLAIGNKEIHRVENVNGDWQIETVLTGIQINCLVSDPSQPQRVYLGTQMNGVMVSIDSGKSWQSIGLHGIPVKSIAVDPHQPNNIYVGSKPVSLYKSENGGESWHELDGLRHSRKWWWFSPADPPDWRAYVMALTVSPTDPSVIMAGVEFGGVLRSTDEGKTWSKHRRGALLDCHSLKFHPTDGNWVYQGGAGLRSGTAFSRDGGLTWRQPKAALGKKYGWMVAADPMQPEVFYISASSQPNLLRREFEPPAHVDGKANASIFRSVGGAPLEPLSGGLPEPLDNMAYALVPDPHASGHLYAGLSNGDVWQTSDFGDSWKQLPFKLGSSLRTMIVIG
jgi:hypothetical protein